MKQPRIETLLEIGIALSREKNAERLLETILDAAMDITNCDGGTLYVLRDNELHFKIMINKTMGSRMGTDGEPVKLPPVPLSPKNVASSAVLLERSINIADVYENDVYDFSGTKKYDEVTGYKCVSMLAVPMEDDTGEIIGVLQLINARDNDNVTVAFDESIERVIFSLASQAAICISNRNRAKEIVDLLDSFVRVVSVAIDARSPYNANHTRNMANYAVKFLDWLNESGEMVFDEVRTRQLVMSVWLHDVGKLVVPLEVMDKATRLGHRLKDVKHRFKLFEMQNEINFLNGTISEGDYNGRAWEIDAALDLINTADSAGFLHDDVFARLEALGERRMEGPDGYEPCLDGEELACLLIRKGTLTAGEREIMESHAVMTSRMLLEMNFPKNYRSVPVWAGSHHEHINGRGYPNKLSGDEILVEVRIITILDIFEALTASDRPYRRAMTPEKAFEILDDMALHGQVDGGLLGLFKRSGVWG